MNNVERPLLASCRGAGPRLAAAALAMSFAALSHGGATDISATPIISTTAALVKPNIMLLMDASGSMARTHMPDEVETQTKPISFGYKSAQCNSLYYNPATTYFLPRAYDTTPFAAPSFNSAPYSGYGGFFAVPNNTTKDLATQFVAYEGATLENNSYPTLDPAQAAYYFVYTGAQTLKFSTAPCTDQDISSPSTAGVFPATGGGTWTKVLVTSLSPAEQQNFAIWYSYYRTRIALIKSAASLTFAPLNETKRVGFITVQPKNLPGDAGIAGSAPNWPRYLPIDDFTTTVNGQKDKWFRKLFSQEPGGASPAREGLARVGRYYAGKEDSINTNMPATGAADPVKYACQQNFTIMTTDGYWNGQTESKGPGLSGGGLALDGTTKVGQQDGDLGDPYSPRPFWDGASDSIHVVTDKSNAYTDNSCSLAGNYRSTFQTQRQVENLTRDSSLTTKRTVQYYEKSVQAFATTTQTTSVSTHDVRRTEQFALRREHFVEEKYRHVKWQEQTKKVTEQYELETRQTLKQTFQTRQVDERILKTTEQWQKSTSQSVATSTQYMQERVQFRLGRRQVKMHQFQTMQKLNGEEFYSATSGECSTNPGDLCRIDELFGPAFVDPSTCTTGPGPTVGTGPNYIKTECIPGPSALAYGPVASCAPGFTAASNTNSWVETTCDRVPLPLVDGGASTGPTAINGTCVDGATTQDASPTFYLYICSVPSATNKATPVASCGVYPPPSAPDWITTTCGQPAGPNNQPLAPSLPCTEPGSTDPVTFVTTTCTKTINTSGYVGTCAQDPGTSGTFTKVTCGAPEPLADAAVPVGSCSPGDMGTFSRSCPRTAVAPNAAPTPVDASTCTAGPGTATDYIETTCTPNNSIAFTTAALCGTPGITLADGTNNWTYSDCRKPAGANNDTVFADPRTCFDDPGTSSPYLKTTCTTTETMPRTGVKPSDCPIGPPTYGGGPDFTVTHCEKEGVSPPTNVAACTPTDPNVPPYTVTSCGSTSTDEPILTCVEGATYMDGADTVTCVRNATGPTQVALCTNQNPLPGNSYMHVMCDGPTSDPAVVVPPNSCNGTYTLADHYFVCTTAGVAPYSTATAVDSCTNGVDVNNVKTTCTFPGGTNYVNKPVPPCTDGLTTDDPGTHIKVTCSKSDTTVPVPPSDAVCVGGGLTQAGSGPEITCATAVSLGVPASACVKGAVQATAPYEATTDCHPTIVSPMADYAGTCSTVTATPGEVIKCGKRPIDVLVADASCVTPTSTDASGLITECTTAGGPGHSYTRITTTTVTTTPFSGGTPSGPDAVSGSSTGPVAVGPACSPDPLVFPDKPAVDIVGCGAWPCTQITASSGGSENSLADVAQYYYKTDLRPTPAWPNNVFPAGVGPEDDKAQHQHMTTFVVALGVSGTLAFQPDYRSMSTVTGDFAKIRLGTKDWPIWPNPALDQPLTPCASFPAPTTNTYQCNSNLYDNPKSIDDFWHAAVNGRGRYFNGNDPSSVVQGLGDALANIGDKGFSGTADAVSTYQPVSGNNFAYSTSYKSGSWQGDIEAKAVDLGNGSLGPTVWSAKALLDARTFPTCDERKILFFRAGALVDFTWSTQLCPGGVSPTATTDGLTAAEVSDYFGVLKVKGLTQYNLMTDGTAGSAQQKQEIEKPEHLVNFLRGQRGNEDFQTNSLTKLFRHRGAVLGDIVNSQPVYVGQPVFDYQEHDYAGFKGTPRAAMLYAGANDGMLHAFNATFTGTDPGKERWAVIPSPVLPNLYKLADDNYKRDGHQFYVDGTPVVGDVWNGTEWKTILVGGLNAGGKGYYALDISNPGVVPTPLWEFKQDSTKCPLPAPSPMPGGIFADCNLGLTFGKPVITKLAGNWVVMVTSGYNNSNGVAGDGLGYLYVLDAFTGELKIKIATTEGSNGTPSGLAQINNYVNNVNIDNTTLRAYGGDVLGNIWRFDFSPPSATKLGVARDLGGVAEPITVRPELAEIDGKPFVMVGTGRLLGGDDVGPPGAQKQSVFGFKDTLATTSPVYANLRSVLKPMVINQTGTLAGATRTAACSAVGAPCDRTDGWVVDLPEVGERVTVEMKVFLGALVFSSNVPDQEPCTLGGHSWLNVIDFRTGKPVPGTDVSDFLGETLNVGFNILQLPLIAGQPAPTRTIGYRQHTGAGGNRPRRFPEPVPQGRRVSWREIAQ